MLYKIGLVLVFINLLSIKCTLSERLHEQIYSFIEGGAACFRRLNGTHQTGCSSIEGGAVGVVHIIRNVSDAQWVLTNGTTGPYIGVVSTTVFDSVIKLFLLQPDNIAGIVLYDNATDEPKSFSQESRCPNEYSASADSQCSSGQAGGFVWNEGGTGLLQRDIPFPIYYLPESQSTELDKIMNCYERFNTDKNNQRGKPLCSVQLKSFMLAAVNSVVCLRRSAASSFLTSTKVCELLGDNNVYYSLLPLKKKKDSTEKNILVTARIDTASMFDGVSPGAASSVVGMVTLITAAQTLSAMVPVNETYAKNVLWTLFNGESFDYIGSQRVAYDISQGTWPPVSPLSPSDIAMHVELGEIGGGLRSKEELWPLYAMAPYAELPTEIAEFTSNLKSYINITDTLSTNLPPSSLHSFRRILAKEIESKQLQQLVIVDHEQTFTNKFYHSVLDNYTNIGYVYRNIGIGSNGTFYSTDFLLSNGTMNASDAQVKISRLATALSRALYEQVTGKTYTGSVTSSAHLVDEMLYCFLQSQACNLLLAADYMMSTGNAEAIPTQPATLYVNVASFNGSAAAFAGHLLALLTGTQRQVNKTVCDSYTADHPEFNYYYLKGWNHSGICIETTMNFSQAISPAFTIPDYDMTSGNYSTWTESVWQTFWARVFVSAGGGGARIAGGCGGVFTALAAFLTYWLHRHAALLFPSPPSASLATIPATTGSLRSVNC